MPPIILLPEDTLLHLCNECRRVPAQACIHHFRQSASIISVEDENDPFYADGKETFFLIHLPKCYSCEISEAVSTQVIWQYTCDRSFILR